MSPSIMNASSNGKLSKNRRVEENRKAVPKVNKGHEGIRKEKLKVKKIKTIMKVNAKNNLVLNDAKRSKIKGKLQSQGKKKGQVIRNGCKRKPEKQFQSKDDEYITEEEVVLENNNQEIDEPMEEENGEEFQENRKAVPKVNKGHEGIRKEKSKVKKIKTIMKVNAKNNLVLNDAKRSKIKGKLQSQGKKKGQVIRNGCKRKPEKQFQSKDDEYITEEEVVLENNNQEIDEPMEEENDSNSVRDGRDAFSWLIAPIKIEDFFQNAWEKAPLHVKRTDFPDYYKAILSSEKINDILRDNSVIFSKNIDVTSYRYGERQTHNPAGRATPSVVWDFYKKGCSVRMLNPQTFCTELGKLNATLQDFFGSFVGANSYLTPANSQGFAPHYDDIEAFILQIEGRKHWKVYAPREPGEVLPRFSSKNFTQNELNKPVLEVTLHPGDLLYFPRGFIHQASTEPGHHSLHVTVSCYQKNTWGDLLEKLVPAALTLAQEEDVEFRRGLPLDYLRHLGVSNSENDSAQRMEFFKHLQMLFARLLQHAPVDAAVDQMGKQFMHDALPPVLSTEEEKCSVFYENNMKLNEDGSVSGKISLCSHCRVKLIRSHVLRLVKEDSESDAVQVYHCIDNSLEYHGEEPQMFEVSSEFALAIERLVHAYPQFTPVQSFQLDRMEDKLELANLLWKKGLLLTEKPLQIKC